MGLLDTMNTWALDKQVQKEIVVVIEGDNSKRLQNRQRGVS